jgi:hypothetical protein
LIHLHSRLCPLFSVVIVIAVWCNRLKHRKSFEVNVAITYSSVCSHFKFL